MVVQSTSGKKKFFVAGLLQNSITDAAQAKLY
jgi:hypothetical protein